MRNLPAPEYEDEDGDPLPEERVLEDMPAVVEFNFLSSTQIGKVIDDDLAHYHFILTQLQEGWKRSFSVDDICKMALTQAKILEMRRKAMQTTFEPQGQGGFGKNAVSTPYDD